MVVDKVNTINVEILHSQQKTTPMIKHINRKTCGNVQHKENEVVLQKKLRIFHMNILV